MEALFTILAITLVQIPGLVVRYLPFSKRLEDTIKNRLFICYAFCFLFQAGVVLILIRLNYSSFTPLTYKRLLFALSTLYVIINMLVIKGSLYKHLFVYGMQGGYTIFIHSFVAVFVGSISDRLPVYMQFIAQTIIYVMLFSIFFIPLWKVVRDSIIFNSNITNDYYWNIVWLIPALVIYSDALITMNNQWINSFPQILSRIMTALALIISWKWITLDFESLEKMLELRHLNKVLHLQADGIMAQAHILNEADKHIKICKHDMRHNLVILSLLIRDNKIDDALSYINGLNQNMGDSKPTIFCQNTIINSAILVYMSRAEESEIPVSLDISIPSHLPWSDDDIAILIANTFENAINASLKQPAEKREISLSARFSDNKLAIIIKNKFNGTILFDHNGFPITTEENHGIGIQSVISIANKYKAFASCHYTDDWVNMTFLFTD